MSTRLGTLTLDLIAKIGGYISPIREAERQTQTSFAKMRDSVSKYGPIVAGMAATAGGALLAMAAQYTQAAIEVERFAFLSNASTTEFQKMAVGAETVGISAEKLSDQMKDFNEKLGEFITLGSGGALDFFEQIAIQTEGGAEGARKLALEMQRLSGPQALQLYVDKMEEAGVTQQQMSFYLESMASDTTALIPLLRNGGEGFKLWADAAERAGAVMDDEAIRSAKEMKAQIHLLDLQMTGFKNELLQGTIPALVDIADAFNSADVEGQGLASTGQVMGNVLRGVAAIAMGVYASINAVAVSIAGLAATATQSRDVITGGQGWWKTLFQPGWRTIGLAAGAVATHAGEDLQTGFEQTSKTINGLFDDAVSNATAKMGQLQTAMDGAAKGSQDWVDKQNKAEKATKKNNKELNDQKRLLEEQKQLRESLIYAFADNEYKLQLDYEKQIAEVRKAGFPADQEKRFLDASKNRYQTERDLLQAQMAFDISEHRLNEEEKLNFSLALQQKEIAARTDIADNLKGLYYKAAQQQHDQEMAWLRLEQAQRLQDAQSYYLTGMQNMTARYEFEREQIRLNKELLEEDKVALIGASYRSQDRENDDARYAAWGNYRDAIGIDMSAEDDRSRREEAITEALEWELITKEEYQQKMLESEAEYMNARAQLQLNGWESIASGTASIMADMFGKQSAAYKIMFAVEKGFAIAQSALAIQQSVAKAMALGFPQNIPVIGQAVMQGAQIISTIKSVQLAGQAHDGLEYVPREGTYLLDKGERVVTSDTSAKLDRTLDKVQQTGTSGDVIINNYTSAEVSASTGSSGELILTIQKTIDQYVPAQFSNPNSRLSTSVTNNFNTQRNRK
jgi:hypothetical protein